MAEKDTEGPSLELPSLGFRRKRRGRSERDAEPAPEPEQTVEAPPEPEPEAAPAEAPQEPEPEAAPPEAQPVAPPPQPVAQEPTPARAPVLTHEDTQEPSPAPDRPRITVPQLGPVPATLVTGLLVGVITVGLVWVSLRVCEVARGTSSCGNPGFLLLVAVLVAAALAGAALLRAFGIADGSGTSFLAMALVAVLLLLVLTDHLFAWWMVLAVPAVAMPSYLVSHLLTTATVEPGGPELHR